MKAIKWLFVKLLSEFSPARPPAALADARRAALAAALGLLAGR